MGDQVHGEHEGAEMMSFNFQVDPGSIRFLRNMEKRFPREMKRAYLRAGSIVVRQMRGAMKPGKSRGKFKVEKWTDLTERIRAIQQQPYRKTFGGQMTHPDRKQIALYPKGNGFKVGWVGELEEWARKFQDGGEAVMYKSFRMFLYRHGFVRGEVPEYSHQAQRPVVDPIGEAAQRDFPFWVLGILKKSIGRRIMTYQRSGSAEAAARAAGDVASYYEGVALS